MAAKRDEESAALSFFFKTKYPVHDPETRLAVEQKLGIQIRYTLVGDSELEDDEKFIDGYNAYAIQKIEEQHGVEIAQHFCSLNWDAVLTAER